MTLTRSRLGLYPSLMEDFFTGFSPKSFQLNPQSPAINIKEVENGYEMELSVPDATNAQLPDTFTIEQFNDLVARVTALENA